ncbi:MucBP domain-containing protein [Streptococcus parasuis]|uniref:MucBP domain-containing protein n=1 Tax=Streptococcus parasuis TaxID=1501662 RepID=UPI004063025B
MENKRLSKTNQQKWYAPQQRFSIRKYHFGAASVLLGVALALMGGAEASATTTDTSASITPSSAVETTSSTTDSTTPTSDVSTTTSTSETTLSSATEEVATTATATERVATIEYTVEYQDESGNVVESTVKSVETKTTDKTAIAIVTETATVPADYELVANQLTTSTTGVVEGANTKVVFKVVKKVAADTTSTTASTSATDTASTTSTASTPTSSSTAAVPATTTAATTSTAKATTTVTEAKVILEQNISEAQVLSDEANRLYTASPKGNEALKIVADATKLAATQATATFENSVATLEQVNAQISAVRTNVEALVLELRKYLGTEDIQVLLATTATNLQNVGDADGILIETGTTTTPDMSNANGASVTSKASGELKPTENSEYLTVQYTPVAYFDAVASVYSPFKENGGTSTGGSYFRTSVKPTNLYGKVLVELVSKDGTVLEAKEVEPNTAVNFDYYTRSHGAGYPFVYTYEPDYDSEDMFGVIRVQWANNTMSAVSQKLTRPITNTTVYMTEEGQQLATYTVLTTPDLNTTPSEKREFEGYTYKETKTTTSNVVLVPSEPFVEVTRFGTSGVQFKTIVEAVGTDGTIKKTYYVADPNYTGTQSYTDTNLDGFIPILETNDMPLGSANTNLKLLPSLLDSGYEIYRVDASTEKIYPDKEGDKQPTPIRGTLITDAAELDFSTLTSTSQWFHIKFNEKQDGTLAFIRVRQNVVGNSSRITFEYDTRDMSGSTTDTGTGEGGLGVRPTSWIGISHTISLNNNAQTVTETTHIYTPIPQEAIIRYQVEGSTDYLEDSGTLTGNPGTDITYSTEDTINKYKKLGYELVSDNFTTDAGQNYDYDSTVKQEFLVVIKPRVVDVPKGVVPGEPVDPTDPNSPVWPDTVKNQETTQEVMRTVEYKYEDGTPVRVDASGNILPKDSTEGTPLVKTQTVTFTRQAQVNLVTGEITYGEWSADSTDVLSGNLIPEITDYTATRTTLEGADAPMTETVKDKTVAATDADINEVVYFKENPKYGDVVVNYVNTDGKVIATPVVDTNDALVGTDYSTVDRVPEKIVEDTTGDVYYYKEIKAEDAAKETGKVVEGTTEVTYVYEPGGSVTVNYVTTDGKVIKSPVKDEENAEPGKSYSTEDNKPTTITTEDGKTYKLVPNATKGNENGTITSGKDEQVTYVYEEVKGSVVVNYIDTEGNVIKAPVTDTPSTSTGTAYDTKDNKPTTITTDDGTTYELVPVLTKGSETGKVVEGETVVTYVYRKVVTPTPDVKTGSVVIRYVEAGNESNVLKDPVLDENMVPTGTKYDTTDEGDKPTEITKDGSRYVLVPSKTTAVDPNGNAVTEKGEVAEGTTVITYKYQKVANWIPEIPGVPENERPVVPYPFDPNNPDVPVTPTPGTVIPNVPGYTPVDPKDNTPLKPVDPNDPGKGYVPPTPDETGKDTPIPYVQNGNVVVNYVTEDGTVIKSPVKDETDAPAGKSYDTTDNKPTEIVTEDGSRYVLIPSKTIGTENGTVEGGKTTEITYVYQKVANWIPEIPGVPENERPVVPYPFDPNNPDVPVTPNPGTVIPNVPGYTPVDPKDNTPLKPVDPNDPGKGYVPPTPDETGKDTPIPYVQNGNVVVNYVTEDGTVIKSPVKDETDAPAGKSYDTTDNKPTEIVTEDGSRYVLIPSKTIGTENGTVEGGKTTEITYVYKKVANWIPEIPGVPENERPVVPYPFDPNNPDVPVTPNPGTVIPNVPGYTPVDPKDNTPLKPVDPNDPGKGYVPPTPEKPGEDTPIPYVQNGNVVVNYVTEDGTVIKSPVKDETDAPAGKSYDTTDNKPTEIITEDGSRYVLIPSKTIGSETGKVEGGKTTEITYVYKKVANWIPEIPGVPENERPVVPYPFDPNNPDVPVTPNPGTVIPNVPGYTPVDPKDNTPLKPVDPNDPGKGYVPPTPDETGKDTPIPYVQNGNVVVNYVTEDGKVIKSPVKDENDAPAGKSYDTTDNKPTEIVTEDGSRYVLIPSKTIGSETGKVEGGKTTEITYVYKKVANWIPEIPGVPENERPVVPYPFDPNNPDVPVTPTPGTVIPNVLGYTPVDPKDNTPLKPVDPNDPGKGYVPPTPDETGKDTPIPYVQNGNVVVNYVTEDGTVIKSPVKDENDAPAGKSYDTTDNKPTEIVTEDGTTYELVRVDGSENGTVVGGKTTEVTYVYRKVETPAKKVVTNHVDENGNPIAPQEDGTTPNKSIPGYEFTGKTYTDGDGNTYHVYRKVSNPVAPKPQTPATPAPQAPATPKPETPAAPATTAKAGVAQLPNTGESSSAVVTVLGAGMLLASLGLVGKRRKEDEE